MGQLIQKITVDVSVEEMAIKSEQSLSPHQSSTQNFQRLNRAAANTVWAHGSIFL